MEKRKRIGCIMWVGGKKRRLKRILPMLPEHSTYVEPFAGGASVLLNKAPSYQEVLNDIDGDLLHFWRTVRDRHEELIRSFDYVLCSRELFNEYAHRFREHDYEDDIQRAHVFYYLNRATFGAKMNSPAFGVSVGKSVRQPLRMSRVEESISAVYERIRDVVIEQMTFSDLIPRYDRPNTLFFMDPPYRVATTYRVGMFSDDDYRELANLCENMRGKFLLTINDNPFIRKLFSQFRLHEQNVTYFLNSEDNTQKARELYITNYEPAESAFKPRAAEA